MNNGLIISILTGIGFALCVVAVSNTAIMFYLGHHAGGANSLIYSEANIATAALGMAIMFVAKFLKNVDERLTTSRDRSK